MWLQYALNKDNNLVSVHDCSRGRSEIRCPYCQGELTAKKGRVKAHHFAHLNDTCNHVRSSGSIGLPLYDRFDLGLKPSVLKGLLQQWDRRKSDNPPIYNYGSYLEGLGLAKYNEYRFRGDGAYEFTKLGKIAVGGLSLMLFSQVQEPRIIEKLEEIEDEIGERKELLSQYSLHPLYGTSREVQKQEFQDIITDYQIFLRQYQRILSNSLYFLEIIADSEIYHKIGVTTRDIEQRISEIKRDLTKHFSSVSIKGLGIWEHRGNVEYYFKYRYRKFSHPIGCLTEYFKFDDVKPVLRDLRRIKPKQLSDREREILDNKPFEKSLLSLYIRYGMQKAKQENIHIGRPKGETESPKKFLSKPRNKAIATVLKKGLSLRQTASEAGVSVNTVRKVKAALEQIQNLTRTIIRAEIRLVCRLSASCLQATTNTCPLLYKVIN